MALTKWRRQLFFLKFCEGSAGQFTIYTDKRIKLGTKYSHSDLLYVDYQAAVAYNRLV